MQIYPEGFIVAYEVPLVDLNGQQVVPSVVEVHVSNDRGEEITAFGVVFENGFASFEVDSSTNTMSEDAAVEGRVVNVIMRTDQGVIERRMIYMLRRADRLKAPSTSFQTLEQSLFTAFEMVDVAAFDAASDEKKEAALLEAYLRITRIALKVADIDPTIEIVPENRRFLNYTYLRQFDWPELPKETFDAFPRYFHNALRRAQVAEANSILAGDPIGAKRRAGIISESIGESSMMFRNGIIDLGVSAPAIAYLTGLVHYDMRITR